MNIFHDLEGILAPPKTQSGSVMDLLRLAADIRAKLGSQGYLVERYLSDIFQALAASSSFQSSEAGFEESCELRKLCSHAMNSRSGSQASNNKKEAEKHPFYPVVKKHFEEHPDVLQLPLAVLSRHYAMLSQEFLQFALSGFVEDQKDKICRAVDCVALNKLYTEIAAIVGESHMERLNRLLTEQFLTVPASIGYAYGLSCALVDSLTYVANETGKQIFLHLMDECSEGKRRQADGI
jgi:hypothetical protein